MCVGGTRFCHEHFKSAPKPVQTSTVPSNRQVAGCTVGCVVDRAGVVISRGQLVASTMAVNPTNLVEVSPDELKMCDAWFQHPKVYPIPLEQTGTTRVVTVVGDTGSGKSTLIAQMLAGADAVSTPLVGDASGSTSTTAGMNMFLARNGDTRLLLIDCEGSRAGNEAPVETKAGGWYTAVAEL